MKKILLALGLISVGGALALSVPSSVPAAVSPPAIITMPASVRVDYGWPSGAEVSVLRPFAPGAENWLSGHRGVDLAIAAGQPVFAAAAGRVIYAGVLNDRELVSIEHADGIRTTYEPITPAVVRGDIVSRGDLIGHVVGKHCFPQSCLHWGAKRGKDGYIDPLSLLREPIRLYE